LTFEEMSWCCFVHTMEDSDHQNAFIVQNIEQTQIFEFNRRKKVIQV